MKTKMSRNLLILFAVITAMNHPIIASTPERLEALRQEISKVKEYLAGMENTRLVMGMSNDSGEQAKRFTDNYVFLNETHQAPSNRNLSVDFNDLDELNLVSSELENTFDMVVLDDSTFKFTDWGKEHLSHFKKILKPGGQFIFGPSHLGTTMDFSSEPANMSESLQNLARWLSTKDTLLGGLFAVPFIIKLEKNELADAIEHRFQIYKKFQETPDENWNDLMVKLKINWQPSEHLLKKSDDKIRDYITMDVARKTLSFRFFREQVIPNNIMRIVNDVFDNTAVLEHDKPLPFVSNYNEKQEFLITATKK